MNKKFLKGLAALFAVAVLGVSCSNNNTTPEPEKKELGIAIATKGISTAPIELTLPARASDGVSGDATGVSSTGVSDLKGISYTVNRVTDGQGTETATGNGLKAANYTVQYKNGNSISVAINEEAITALESVAGTSAFNLKVVLDVTAKKEGFKDQNLKIYLAIKGNA